MTEAAAKGQNRFSTMAHLFLSDIRTDNPQMREAGEPNSPPVGKIKRIKPGERADFPPTPLKQTDPPEARQTDPSDFLLSEVDPVDDRQGVGPECCAGPVQLEPAAVAVKSPVKRLQSAFDRLVSE